MHPAQYKTLVANSGVLPSEERARFIERPDAFRKRLLSRDEIEEEYGITRRWLELAAHRGDGPPMRKISRRMVRYDRAEFEAWLDSHRFDPGEAA